MCKNLMFAAVIVIGLCMSAGAQDIGKGASKSAAFEALKKLVGDWTSPEGPHGKPVETNFRLTAGGTVLIETLFPGTPEEMITMYHLDGSDLILTHYCMLGNQPRLKAESASESKKIAFKSIGGTNMKMTDMHMGQATLTLIDQQNFEADWCSCSGGKPDGNHHVTLKFTRKK